MTASNGAVRVITQPQLQYMCVNHPGYHPKKENKLEKVGLDLVVNTDTSQIRFSDLQLSVNGASVTPGQSVAKWSTLTINATIENPTDYTLNFGVLLVVNNISGYASGWVALEPRGSATVTLVWKVSLEGFLVVSMLADDRTMSLPDLRTNSHIQFASSAPGADEVQL